jgi:alpha-N-arabinofuranosidase
MATKIELHTGFVIDEVSPLIFGGFLEHMGRCIYEGVYDPESPHADEDGFRADVLEALRGLDVTVVRYPGGNFASGYHWRDGIGPQDERPTVRELAWQSIETNRFGTDEFLELCSKLGWRPMLTVNLGTGSPEEARDWVEYCNAPTGTRNADLRAANGAREPHGVGLWCLGNEMDGPWQLGHVPARDYAVRAQQAAKMMKDCDRSIRLVACGSSGPQMPTYLAWDREVLEYLGGLADYVSLHRYVGNSNGVTSDYLAVTNSVDRQIEEVDACCRFVQAKRRTAKRTLLCFDEWNVWYKARAREDMDGGGKQAPHLIEEIYNVEDALVVAGFLQSFIRHADCVKIANIAQLVNVIAPLQTRGTEMLIQSIYWPFQMISRRGRGLALRTRVTGPRYESALYGDVSLVDTSAIFDPERSELHVFLTNRNESDAQAVELKMLDRLIRNVVNGEQLSGYGPKDANTWERPSHVVKGDWNGFRIDGHSAYAELPPLSFTAVTLGLEDPQ